MYMHTHTDSHTVEVSYIILVKIKTVLSRTKLLVCNCKDGFSILKGWLIAGICTRIFPQLAGFQSNNILPIQSV